MTCDNQSFIARAPMVWIFLADYQRWSDYFHVSGVEEFCRQRNLAVQKPEESDLFLACCDALIAAQNAVIAAESLGIGSCYIGDIMEQYETHKEILDLPRYVFPICMLVFGYPLSSKRTESIRRASTRSSSCSRTATAAWIKAGSMKCSPSARAAC
jgi:FMN reductase (NADPH)/FMN reductase [NAD(P)H]